MEYYLVTSYEETRDGKVNIGIGLEVFTTRGSGDGHLEVGIIVIEMLVGVGQGKYGLGL